MLRASTRQLFALMLSGLALLIGLGSVAGAVTLANTAKVSDRLQDRIAPAATAVVELSAALVDQETGLRGYLLSGERQFLEPYTTGIDEESAQRARLAQLLRDEPDALADLTKVADAARQWRTTYATPVVDAPGPPSSLAVLPDQTGSKTAFDGLRTDLEALRNHVDRARADGRAALKHAREQRDNIFYAIIAVLVGGLVAIAVLLQVGVLRPLQQVRAAVRRVADGDFEHRVPASGPSDLAELAADVEAMRGRVVDALNDSISTAHQLRRSNSDLEQFAYVASHDLQEPLRKIASFCQMLQRRYGSQLDERAQQYINFAVDGASRMQALINDLLAFSRVGRVYDNVTDVDLSTVVARLTEDLDATVEQAPLPVVAGDPTLLSMLWQNLLTNAVKFRRSGVESHVRIDAEHVEGEWRFAVADNGIGIEPQFAEKIFVIFQRLHPRDVYSGTGIGLAICKRIVEHHGGRIWLDTGYTGGARICFTLPAKPGDPPAPAP